MQVHVENILEDLGIPSFEFTDDGFKELTAKLVKELTATGTMSAESGIGASGDIVACAKSLGFVPFFTDAKDLRLEALFFTATALINARYEDLKEKEDSAMSTSLSQSEAEFEKHIRADMEMRKEMLLKRLDVTTKAFLWSDVVKGREEEVLAKIKDKREALNGSLKPFKEDEVGEGEREGGGGGLGEDDMFAYPSSGMGDTENGAGGVGAGVVTKTVMIGAVPDRGGRPDEKRGSSMPKWQDRKAGGGGGDYKGKKGGGGGGGGGKGAKGTKGAKGGRGGKAGGGGGGGRGEGGKGNESENNISKEKEKGGGIGGDNGGNESITRNKNKNKNKNRKQKKKGGGGGGGRGGGGGGGGDGDGTYSDRNDGKGRKGKADKRQRKNSDGDHVAKSNS
ncbi:hypothetical protein TrVE_jg4183 [Triparma verrucosa]|uniref:Uncharacterized protein n=1 Tax=Triparma verrucosa TaxID=1606542 RepID=A0A9W7C478_9STRA|nr:hypothetical protein TrVE_jg4183 [Triparma verrucosa]